MQVAITIIYHFDKFEQNRLKGVVCWNAKNLISEKMLKTGITPKWLDLYTVPSSLETFNYDVIYVARDNNI